MIEKVKNYLDITWNDEQTDKKLEGVINRAFGILSGYAGVTLNGETLEGDDEQLFLDLCRYIYNKSYEDFVKNFMAEITSMRLKYGARHFKERKAENAQKSADV